MFTPPKVWQGWSLTPLRKKGLGSASDDHSNGTNPREDGTAVKGKGVVTSSELATPIPGRISENGNLHDDPEVLVEKVSQLEKELFEYQYNMGILLIEKREWTSKYEELRQALEEATHSLKRKQAAHLSAISDVEKREESLRRALGIEKQCVADLEKALHEIRSENAQIKFTADSKLAEASALVISVEEKSLEVDAKLHAADARFAEVSRKSSEIERKSQEVGSRESALQRKSLSYLADREAHEAALSKQSEDLREWERKLQEGEERIAKGQTIVKQREDWANEKDKIIRQKEKELEETQKKIDAENLALKSKENEMSTRLNDLAVKEQDCDAVRKTLETKEQSLLALQEKLNSREKVEIQKLLDEHKSRLDMKKNEFELKMNEKRKSLDDSLKSKVVVVDKRETEVNHLLEKIAKREQSLDKKLAKLKEKEKDFDARLKSVGEREKALTSEEKALESEKKKLHDDKEDLLSLKAEVEKIRVENEAQVLKIYEEKDKLRVLEEERSEYVRLQSELKEQIEKCRFQQELLLKEAGDLNAQKESFEKEWEELDERKTEIEKEWKNFNDQKESLEKHRQSEEERLRKEKQVADDYVKRELEALDVAKELFAATMEQERSMIAEKAESERSQLLHDFELRRRKLEIDMQIRQEEKEKEMQVQEKLFEEEKERELSNSNYLSDVARREMEEIKVERHRMEKEKQEIAANKKHLEEQHVEIRKDIDELVVLTERLKDQREQFINERTRFFSFVENNKNCKHCGEVISEFVLSDLELLQEIKNEEIPNLPRLADNYASKAPQGPTGEMPPRVIGSGSLVSGGTRSWLRKCTSKILKLSPIKRMEHPTSVQNSTEQEPPSGGPVHVKSTSMKFGSVENEVGLAIVNDSFCIQTGTREVEVGNDQSENDQSNFSSKTLEVAEDSHSNLNDGQTRRNGKPRIRRAPSVKTVPKDSKAILDKSVEFKECEQLNGDAEDSANANAESRDESGFADKGTLRNVRKRSHADSFNTNTSMPNTSGSDRQSDSFTAGQHRKRRQKIIPDSQAVVEPRYNLRRPRRGVAVTRLSKETEETSGVGAAEDGIFYAKTTVASSVGAAASENGENTHLVRCNVIVDSPDTGTGSPKRTVGIEAMSNEANGKLERAGSENEDEGEEEKSEHPGEVSLGKKLWTFFTT